MPQVNLHGDITLYPVTSKIKPPKDAEIGFLHILQLSETTGNRHEVYSDVSKIHRWKNKDGREYLYSKKPYFIRHIGGDAEHGIQPVELGTREIRRETEYDPWDNELKIVVD